jgi:hypothetical protein
MWQRLHRSRRLGLILGSGATADADLPLWSALVQQLADRARGLAKTVKAHRKAGFRDAYITQILYLLEAVKVGRRPGHVPNRFRHFHVDARWRETVYEELYKKVKGQDFDDILARHSYLAGLGELTYNAGFTVNFNFDDLVDEAAIRYAVEKGRPNTQFPEIIWRPKIETRRLAPVIYHINGYLPREEGRPRSNFLTMTEDAFAEVLVSPNSLESEFIMSRFATTTFLLLGTSLNDDSLKSMLRAGIKRNAANHHYIICWEHSPSRRSDRERSHIFQVNLEVYNLITIFLDTAGYAQLVHLLNETEEDNFENDVLRVSPKEVTRRRYYLVGSIAAGKTTNLEALRCFATVEEWSGRPPVTMYRDHDTLDARERAEVDAWLYPQLKGKNDQMSKTGVGIHVADRAYLDLFAFSRTDDENIQKADELRHQLRMVSARLEPGHILFLSANREALASRQARRGKLRGKRKIVDYDGSKLFAQSKVLRKIYMPYRSSFFDTSWESCDVTSRRLARLILLGEYRPFDFEARIDEVCSNGGKP